jgi:hypothetical protein
MHYFPSKKKMYFLAEFDFDFEEDMAITENTFLLF